MKDTQGYIMEYTTKYGLRQRAVMLHNEQTKVYSDNKKAFLRLIDDDGNYKRNEVGQALISVKHVSELTQIGFQD
jgi:hypothetical protein